MGNIEVLYSNEDEGDGEQGFEKAAGGAEDRG